MSQMYILLSNPIRGGCLNDNGHLMFGAKLQGVKNDFKKIAASLFVYTEIGRYISQIN